MKESEDPAWWKKIRNSWAGLAILAALCNALFGVNDTYIMHQKIVYHDNSQLAIMVYLMYGSVVGLLMYLVVIGLLGKTIYPKFTGLKLADRRLHLYAFIAGLVSTVATAYNLLANQNCDPSLVVSLSNISVLYLVLYDTAISHQERFRLIIAPALLVILGSFLASLVQVTSWRTFQVSVIGLVALVVIKCGLSAGAKIFQKVGVTNADPVNFAFWRFFYLAMGALVTVSLYALYMGQLRELLALFIQVALASLPWVAATMLLANLGNILELTAQKKVSVSRVSMVLSGQVLFGVPLTLAATALWPGIFGELPIGWLVWLLRGIGAIMIFGGCFLLHRLTPADER